MPSPELIAEMGKFNQALIRRRNHARRRAAGSSQAAGVRASPSPAWTAACNGVHSKTSASSPPATGSGRSRTSTRRSTGSSAAPTRCPAPRPSRSANCSRWRISPDLRRARPLQAAAQEHAGFAERRRFRFIDDEFAFLDVVADPARRTNVCVHNERRRGSAARATYASRLRPLFGVLADWQWATLEQHRNLWRQREPDREKCMTRNGRAVFAPAAGSAGALRWGHG